MDHRYRYSSEQAEFIRNNVTGLSNNDLTDAFNNAFGMNVSVDKIKAYKKNNKLTSGLDGRFFKGQVSHNKGKKTGGGPKETLFKKGQIPANYMLVGTERVNSDGYIDIKIADPNIWRAKHKLVWEEHNGPVPAGSVIIFGDGNKLNPDIGNLIMVTRAQLAILNRRGLIQSDADLTRTGIIIADIIKKAYSLQKKAR